MYMDMQRIFVIILTKEQSAHKSFALWDFETKQILTWFWIVIHSYRFFQIMISNEANSRLHTIESFLWWVHKIRIWIIPGSPQKHTVFLMEVWTVTLKNSHWPVDRRSSFVNMATCTAGSEWMR